MRYSLLGLALLSSASFAQSAHQHGLAQLNMVQEQQSLELELIIPADSAVGFEHKPNNDQQKQLVADLQIALQKPSYLFEFKSNCDIKHVEIDMGELSLEHDHADEHKHEDEHDHADEHEHENEHDHADEHEHEDEHDHADEHEHEDEHDHADEDGHTGHTDVHVHYQLECSDTKSFEFVGFTSLHDLQKLEIQAITDKGQTQVILTPTNNVMDW